MQKLSLTFNTKSFQLPAHTDQHLFLKPKEHRRQSPPAPLADVFADWVKLVAQLDEIYFTTQITEILHSNVLRLGGSALAQQFDVHREKCGRNTMTRNPGRIRELCKTVTPETDQSQR